VKQGPPKEQYRWKACRIPGNRTLQATPVSEKMNHFLNELSMKHETFDKWPTNKLSGEHTLSHCRWKSRWFLGSKFVKPASFVYYFIWYYLSVIGPG